MIRSQALCGSEIKEHLLGSSASVSHEVTIRWQLLGHLQRLFHIRLEGDCLSISLLVAQAFLKIHSMVALGQLDLFQGSEVEPGRSWIFYRNQPWKSQHHFHYTLGHQKSQKIKSQLHGKGAQTPPPTGRRVSHIVRACGIGYICILGQWRGGLWI